ncbi:MAG: ferritin-like domain-containing protein [Oscillospiraceae bacterium]|nr:ferritin-like domain-containing protein [Oscillospiraceae bacterium]
MYPYYKRSDVYEDYQSLLLKKNQEESLRNNIYNEYFKFDDYMRSDEITNEEIISFEQALDLIRTSIADEQEDEMFYNSIIQNAPTQKEKEVIMSIRDDERKHNEILRELYYKFTGTMLPHETFVSNMNENTNMTYNQQLEQALLGELEAVKRYRRILGAMPDEDSRTLLISILTDELRHANKYNFLITSAK